MLFTSITINQYREARNKDRKIILYNDNITYKQEDKIIHQIVLTDINSIKRTYSDIFHYSQLGDYMRYIIGLIFTIYLYYINMIIEIYSLFLFMLHIEIPLIKYLFHKYRDKSYLYRHFDAIIIFDNKKRFINILPVTNDEYNQIENYFLEKGFGNIKNKKAHIEILGHLDSKLN